MKRFTIAALAVAISGCSTNPEIARMHYETEQKRYETLNNLEKSRAAVAAAALANPQDNTVLEIVATPGKSINIDAQSIKLRLPANSGNSVASSAYVPTQANSIVPTQQYVEQVHPGWQVASSALTTLSPVLGVWATLKGAQGIVSAVSDSNAAIAGSGFAANSSIANSGFASNQAISTSGMNNLTTLGQSGLTATQNVATSGMTNLTTLGQSGLTATQTVANTGLNNLNTLGTTGMTNLTTLGQSGITGVQTTATAGMTNLTTLGTAGITNVSTVGQAGITGVQTTANTAVTNLTTVGQAGITGVQNAAGSAKVCTVNATTGVLTCNP